MRLKRIKTENAWRLVVFDHSDNHVGEFFVSENSEGGMNGDFPFNFTFESPEYDRVMIDVLRKQEIINDWLADNDALNTLDI